jgi:hypothetical protein
MTITATIPRQAERLISYLNANGGSESTAFEDDKGQPNLEAARVFAEKLRLVHKKYLDVLISIEQKYNRVILTVLP